MLIAQGKFVLCSGYLSMLEAMSYGRVPIAYFENELKKDYLFPFSTGIYAAGDATQYKTLLLSAVTNDLDPKSNGAELLLAQHTWRKTAEVIEQMARGTYAPD